MCDKKLVLVIVFFLSISSNSYSQNFKASLIAGLSSSQVSGDNLAGFDKAGLLFGSAIGLRFSDKFSSQFEIIYVEKGSRKNANPDKNDFTAYKLNLNYIEVPVLIRYHVKPRITLEAGPSLGVLISSKEEDQYGPFINPRPFNKTETSLAGGVNYKISNKLSANWRISNSILPIRPHASGEVHGLNRGQYNTAMYFTLRYGFN